MPRGKPTENIRLPVELVSILKKNKENLSAKDYDSYLKNMVKSTSSIDQLKNEHIGFQRKNIELNNSIKDYNEKKMLLSESDVIREKDLVIMLKNEEITKLNVQIDALKKLI